MALQKYHLKDREMTFGLEYRLSIESPQLAFLSTHLRPEEIEEIYRSDNWIFEKKLNGVIMMVTYHPNSGFEFYSRNLSVSDYLPTEYSEKIWLGTEVSFKNTFSSFVLDCEIMSSNPNICTVMGKRGVVTENELQAVTALLALNKEDSIRIQKEMNGPLKLHVFDCLYWEGKDLKKLSYIERRKYVGLVVEKLNEMFLPLKKLRLFKKIKRGILSSFGRIRVKVVLQRDWIWLIWLPNLVQGMVGLNLKELRPVI